MGRYRSDSLDRSPDGSEPREGQGSGGSPDSVARARMPVAAGKRQKKKEIPLSSDAFRGEWIDSATRADVVRILEHVPCGVFVVGGHGGQSLYINPECVRISGYDLRDVPTALVARDILFSDQETRQSQARRHEEMISGSQQEPFLSTIICKNGREKICETRIIGLPDGKLVGVWTDVTRREIAETELRSREKALVKAKEELEDRVRERTLELTEVNRELGKSREELRLLSEYLQRAREEERTRVAREVHDELGQLLTALKMDLAYCGQHLHGDRTVVGDRMGAMEKQIDLGIETVRKICSDLRPHVLERLGLQAGIDWYVRGFEKRTGIRCTASTLQEVPELDKDLSLVLFRVLQEAMTNVVRHAGATHVRVQLEDKGDRLVLKVKDNGKGISREDVDNPSSFGIIGIRERIRFRGGKLTIVGTPGRGTTVKISIPRSQRKTGNTGRIDESKRQGRGRT
jgi:signal transduction histidine kinase